MPSANGTTTETQEVRPQLLVRTSQFLKKVSNFRTPRKKSESRSYDRSARSMDLGSKALSKVDVRTHHQSFDHDRDSGESSPYHVSLPNTSPNVLRTNVLPPASQSGPGVDGLPRTSDPLPCTTSSSASLPIGNRTQPLPLLSIPSASSPPITISAKAKDAPILTDSPTGITSSSPLTAGSRALTLPSRGLSIHEVPRDGIQQSATLSTSSRRALAPRLATLPPPMMAGYHTEGRARLTPSLVTRQPPMPILNLPTLPPPTPSQPARPGRPRAPLRSIPALPMRGPSDADQDADHESASLEDEEEEEDGDDNAETASGEGHDGGDSGESGDEEDHHNLETPAAGPSHLDSLPPVDTSRFSVSFADPDSSRSQRTPHAHAAAANLVDYFSSKSPEPMFSPLLTPRPADFHPHGKGRIQDLPQPRIVPMPPTPGSPRPGLYHHGSKSMVDLLSISRKEKDKVFSPKLGRALSRKKSQALTMEGQPPPAEQEQLAPEPESPEDVISSPMLRRRRSLPVYEPSSDPPPYPDPLFQRPRSKQADIIQPRDEEGREQLPPYSNAVYLAGVMPRKMEFTQPGVQARDRKWRRVYCVLEGTMFRVYKAPPAASTVSAIEQWWENKVGVGDITSVDVTAMTTTGIRVSAVRERAREDQPERPQKIVEEPAGGQAANANTAETPRAPSPQPTRSRLNLGARLLHRQRSRSASRLGGHFNTSSSRLSMDSRQDAMARPSASQLDMRMRRSMDTLGSSRTSNVSSSVTSHATTSTTLTVPSPTSSSSFGGSGDSTSLFSRSRFLSHAHPGEGKEKEKEVPYVPDEKDLIKKYTLQHAESGLASDYQKRKNVVRVRMEGEQFLLQAKDVASVIDWIEGIQTGTNVALDLDERPMPRGPIFPRRRRRRVRRVDPAAPGS